MMVEPKLRFKADDGSDFPDWEEEMLGELVEIQRGGSPRPISKFITTGEGINWIKIGDAPSHGNCITKVKERIIPEGKAKSREVHKGDLLLSNSMSFGRPYILGVDGCIHDGWLVVHDTNAVFETEFLCGYLGTESVFRQYKRLAAGSAVNNLNKDLVSSVVLGVPSLPEQRKIADLLSAVDDVISAQEAEVAAWEKRKKGVMQKLFSQEVRFKADDGSDFPDWEEQKIEDVCVLNPRTEQLDDEFYYMDLGSIDHGRWEAPEIVNKVDAPSRAQRVAAIDDVFFQSVRPYNMGHYHYVAAKDKQVVASTGYIQARMRNGSNAFLYQLFYEERFNAEVNARCTGSNYPAINSRKFGEITVALPSHPEQRKIADCLSALDDVIIKAKNELAKWQELKKGLLQQMFV